VATVACTATMIGVANVTVILLRRTGFNKGVRKLLAMGIGQVATAAVGSYFLISNGFGRLFTLPLSRKLALIWVTATVAATLTVAISNRISGESDIPMAESFRELYCVCRPCMFALLIAVAPVCEEILFRGLGQEWLAAIIGFWPALAIAAANCTAGHVKALGFGRQLIPVAVLAVILGVEVGVLGTLIPAMVTHAVCNLVGMHDTLIYVKGDHTVCNGGGRQWMV